ncbi:MAG: type I DNA topoisomerase [Pseudohongiella sp.]|nr:type I DNA topoisomerase [Pseudohongiella sp.]
MTTLVIVESPGKVKKISALLGPSFKVAASVGHVRDLPQKEMGVAPPTFKPSYVPTERGNDVLAKLRQAVAAASNVILATDPDREGEAIAWHLADALKIAHAKRVTFTGITKSAIESAFAAPRSIDMAFVRAQEARRVLDRIIGYLVSPALSNRAGTPLTAGRVQSPAVRLVVDRERAIAAFEVTEHFGAELTFQNQDGTTWCAVWDTKPHLQDGQEYILTPDLARLVADVQSVRVTHFENTSKTKAPPAPFTTSTLQQIAGRKLKLTPKRVMELAQRLYEQGAITYHRTDSPNIDAEGQADIANYARNAGLPLADKPRTWKAKQGAQQGHEAIRPTHAADIDAGENPEERDLYRLIWQRAVSSQLADALYKVRTATLSGSVGAQVVKFVATGRTLTAPGWQVVYSDDSEEDDDLQESPVPELKVGDLLTATNGRLLIKHTKAPPRFTQHTLVAEMERQGIGRPSTYATIIDGITQRGYVTTQEKGHLIPSAIGESVRDALVGRFRFAELDYTRELEDQLDSIAAGEAEYLPTVAAAWLALEVELKQLDNDEINIPIAHPCPDCGKALTQKKGQFGLFWSCTGWPECATKLPNSRGRPGARKAPPQPTGIHCPKCSAELVRRQGTSKPPKKGVKGKPYDFYGCTGFPKCNATYQTGPDGKALLPETSPL